MSSGSESDDEYVPEEPSEKLSEEESADEETEQQYENEAEIKTQKRKSKQQNKPRKKLKKDNVKERTTETVNPEDEKKKEEDLWAKFLEGTDTKPKPKTQESIMKPDTNIEQTSNSENKKKIGKQTTETDKDREKRIFEFAGETIVVENNVIKERVKTAEKPALASSGGPSARSKPAGLSSLVGQLNKKNKLSTLEKSKLDWNTYKKEEGIEEEITSHNKGKNGYLDRQDFLGRTDERQYEIERDLRMTKRSNR